MRWAYRNREAQESDKHAALVVLQGDRDQGSLDRDDQFDELVRQINRNFKDVPSVDLSDNRIRRLESLAQLSSLKTLNISGSRLECLELYSLKNLSGLEDLCVKDSCVCLVPDSISHLSSLKLLDLQGNNLRQLPALVHLQSWRLKSFPKTATEQVSEVQLGTLSSLRNLRHLTLRGNPAAKSLTYREDVCQALPQLETLDGQEILPVVQPLDNTASLSTLCPKPSPLDAASPIGSPGKGRKIGAYLPPKVLQMESLASAPKAPPSPRLTGTARPERTYEGMYAARSAFQRSTSQMSENGRTEDSSSSAQSLDLMVPRDQSASPQPRPSSDASTTQALVSHYEQLHRQSKEDLPQRENTGTAEPPPETGELTPEAAPAMRYWTRFWTRKRSARAAKQSAEVDLAQAEGVGEDKVKEETPAKVAESMFKALADAHPVSPRREIAVLADLEESVAEAPDVAALTCRVKGNRVRNGCIHNNLSEAPGADQPDAAGSARASLDAQGPAKPEAPAQCSADEQQADETQHDSEQGQGVKQGGWWSRWSARTAAAAPTATVDDAPKASSLNADQPPPLAQSTEDMAKEVKARIYAAQLSDPKMQAILDQVKRRLEAQERAKAAQPMQEQTEEEPSKEMTVPSTPAKAGSGGWASMWSRKPSGDLDAKKNNAGAGFVDEGKKSMAATSPAEVLRHTRGSRFLEAVTHEGPSLKCIAPPTENNNNSNSNTWVGPPVGGTSDKMMMIVRQQRAAHEQQVKELEAALAAEKERVSKVTKHLAMQLELEHIYRQDAEQRAEKLHRKVQALAARFAESSWDAPHKQAAGRHAGMLNGMLPKE